MSPSGAYEDEVHSLRHISDEDADRLLSGDLPAGDRSLDELAAFLQDVGVAYSAPPTGPVQARHLEEMRRAARPNAAGWNPSAEPAEPDSAPGRDGPGLPERVRRTLAGWAPRPRLAAAAGLAVCLAFSTLTALGELPEPVQAAVAGAARAVGVPVPSPHAERSKPEPRRGEHGRKAPDPGAAQIVAPPPARPAGGRPPVAPRGTEPKTGSCGPTDCASDGMDQLPTPTTPDPPPPGAPSDLPPRAPPESAPGPAPEPQPDAGGDQSGTPSQSPLPVP
jgi:hypothetical protein